ncbi:MAG: hypothetical protein KGI06_01480 [Candidatus Micrarchaeota archaeon]|nr:hypothetical protein [Candidatus Micrarchaeota archaeon]
MVTRTRNYNDETAGGGDGTGESIVKRARSRIKKQLGALTIAVAFSSPIALAQNPRPVGNITDVGQYETVKFSELKYDIQQALLIVDPNYTSKSISALVTPPRTRNSIAMLLNAQSKEGYWYQVGVGKGATSRSIGMEKYGIYYCVFDNKDKMIYFREDSMGKLNPGDTYKVNLGFNGKRIEGRVTDSKNKVLSSRLLPTPGTATQNHFIAVYDHRITGLMTETLSKEKFIPEPPAVYKFYPGPVPARKESLMPKYELGVEIRSIDIVGQNSEKIVYAVETNSYPKETLNVGKYHVTVNQDNADGTYTFTTKSGYGVE